MKLIKYVAGSAALAALLLGTLVFLGDSGIVEKADGVDDSDKFAPDSAVNSLMPSAEQDRTHNNPEPAEIIQSREPPSHDEIARVVTEPQSVAGDELQEVREIREQKLALAALENRVEFEDLAIETYLQGLSDIDTVRANQEKLDALASSIRIDFEFNAEIRCSNSICFLDFFGDAKSATLLLKQIKSRWPVTGDFLSTVNFIKQGPNYYRFYMATAEFPIENITRSAE